MPVTASLVGFAVASSQLHPTPHLTREQQRMPQRDRCLTLLETGVKYSSRQIKLNILTFDSMLFTKAIKWARKKSVWSRHLVLCFWGIRYNMTAEFPSDKIAAYAYTHACVQLGSQYCEQTLPVPLVNLLESLVQSIQWTWKPRCLIVHKELNSSIYCFSAFVSVSPSFPLQNISQFLNSAATHSEISTLYSCIRRMTLCSVLQFFMQRIWYAEMSWEMV
jgi:hypothetical protein